MEAAQAVAALAANASFTTQVTFVGLPEAPATSVPTAAGAATASAHSTGATEPVGSNPSK